MIHVQHALKYSRGGIEITADPTKKCCKTSSIFLKEFSVLLLLPLLKSSLLLQLFLNSSTTLSWVSTAAGAYLEYSIVNSPFPCVAERSAALNPNMLFKGTSASKVNQSSLPSWPVMIPDLPVMRLKMPDVNSVGLFTSTDMTGSSSCQTPSSLTSAKAAWEAW